jgi:hypothetical protein
MTTNNSTKTFDIKRYNAFSALGFLEGVNRGLALTVKITKYQEEMINRQLKAIKVYLDGQ